MTTPNYHSNGSMHLQLQHTSHPVRFHEISYIGEQWCSQFEHDHGRRASRAIEHTLLTDVCMLFPSIRLPVDMIRCTYGARICAAVQPVAKIRSCTRPKLLQISTQNTHVSCTKVWMSTPFVRDRLWNTDMVWASIFRPDLQGLLYILFSAKYVWSKKVRVSYIIL